MLSFERVCLNKGSFYFILFIHSIISMCRVWYFLFVFVGLARSAVEYFEFFFNSYFVFCYCWWASVALSFFVLVSLSIRLVLSESR